MSLTNNFTHFDTIIIVLNIHKYKISLSWCNFSTLEWFWTEHVAVTTYKIVLFAASQYFPSICNAQSCSPAFILKISNRVFATKPILLKLIIDHH